MHFLYKVIAGMMLLCGLAAAQGTPPHDPESRETAFSVSGTPPEGPAPRLVKMKTLIKSQVKRVLDGKMYPTAAEWKPLTQRQKFDYFVRSTYAPRTFINAGVDVLANRVKGRDDPEYETGIRGLGQHYGIELSTSETDVFFQRFLFPALLRQDPRYFRNPELPLPARVLYSMSRVIITRSDSGRETFNASGVLGSVASRAVSDLYVPGQRQGLRPLAGCLTFDLLRDAGANLLHEFWPDMRRKIFHH